MKSVPDVSQAVARNWGEHTDLGVVAVAVAAQTLLWLDNSILDIAMETLADPVRGLGANAGELAWASSSYSLVLAAAMFAGGALGDRYGPRATLFAGLVVFSVASAFAAFSGSALELIVMRGLVGLGSRALAGRRREPRVPASDVHLLDLGHAAVPDRGRVRAQMFPIG